MRRSVFSALGLSLLFTAQAVLGQESALPCARTDKECAYQKVISHKVRTLEFWRAVRSKPLLERVGAAPPELVEYMMLDVVLAGIPTTPRAPALSPDFMADVRAALNGIPANIRELLDRRVAGIWFIEDIGGSGFADIIRWGAAEGVVFIVLDPRQLRDRRANVWATWKENTPFRDDPRWRIEAVIAGPDDKGPGKGRGRDQENNRVNAIQYVLLHELGHALASQGGIHPRWDRPNGEELKRGAYPFHDLSWTWDEKLGHVSRFDAAFPDRRKVRYYFGANLEGRRMLEAYRWIESTNFPTLYAATNPGDDFAESFVTYVHTILMKRPWEVRVIEDGETRFTLKSCWDQPRCAAKRKLLEDILSTR